MAGRLDLCRSAALAAATSILALAAATASAEAAPGDPDPLFSGDGVQQTSFGTTPTGGADEAADAIAAPGGGFYVAGTSRGAILLARYTAAGILDTGFGGGTGLAFIDTPEADRGAAVALDSSGRPVVAGSSGADFALARFTTDGAPDAAFGGGDGLVTTDFAGDDDQGNAVAALSDGRVAVAGVTEGEEDDDAAVAVYTSTGELDSGFGGGDGLAEYDFGTGSEDAAYDVVVAGTTMYVAGSSDAFSATDDFTIAAISTATGALDGTFSGDGIQSVDFNGSFDSAEAITIDASDRLVVGGAAGVPGENRDVGLVRLSRSTGTPDGTFSGDGKATLSFPAVLSSDGVQDVATDSSGAVYFAGDTGSQGPDPGVILVGKVTSAGAPDNGFGGDGLTTVDITPGNSGYDSASALVLNAPSNSLTVFGTAGQSAGNSNLALVRLVASTADPDPAFGGGDGIVTTDVRRLTNSSESARGIALQADGKLVVAGPTNVAPAEPERGDYDFGVARYNADGSLDTAFGSGGIDGDGKVAANFGGGSGGVPGTADDAADVAVQPDGKVVVAGRSGTDVAVARFTAAGVLDPEFGGGDGLVTTDLGGAQGEAAESVIVQGTPGDPGFRIVVGGWQVESSASNGSFALVAYDEAGELDGDFGTGGIARTKIGPAGTSDRAFDIAAQPDGKIVAAGESFSFNQSQQQFAVARYAADGGLDPTFSPGGAEGAGKLLTDFNGLFDSANAVAVRDLGAGALRIYVGGTANAGGADAAIAAYDETGALDPAFSPGGTEGDGRAVFGSATERLYDLQVGPEGTVYGAGNLNSNTETSFGVVRVTAAGAPDPGFGGGDGIAVSDSDQGFNTPALGLVVQPDGKPVAAGGNDLPQNGSDFFVSRYRVDADPVVNPPVEQPKQVDPANPVKKPKCKKGRKLKKVKGKFRCVKKKRKK